MSDEHEGPDAAVVAKFGGVVEPGAMPVATLCVMWYIEPDGSDGVLSKFDGKQRVSTTVGDLMALIHGYLHADD